MKTIGSRRGLLAALAVCVVGSAFAAHTITTRAADPDQACQLALGSNCPKAPNDCSPAVPMDGTTVCTHDARVGVNAVMVANANAFASCLGTHGVTPPVVVHDPYSITFIYAPGVVPPSGTVAYCRVNAVRLANPVSPITVTN